MQISWLAFSILKLHVLNFSCRSIRGLVVTVVDGGAVKTAVVALSAPVIGSLSIMYRARRWSRTWIRDPFGADEICDELILSKLD